MPKRYGRNIATASNRAERPSALPSSANAKSAAERTAERVALALRTMETDRMPSWTENVLRAEPSGHPFDRAVEAPSARLESLDWKAEKRVYLLRHYPYKNDAVFQEYDHLWQKKNRGSGLRGKEKQRYDELHARLSNAQVLEDLPPRHQDAIRAIFSRPERTLFVYDAVTGPKRNRETAEDLLRRFSVPPSQIVSDVPLPQSNAESFLEKQTEMNGKLLQSYEAIRGRISDGIDTVIILWNRSYALSFDHWAENKSTSPKQSMDAFEEHGYAFYDLDRSGGVLPKSASEPSVRPEDFDRIRSVIDPLLNSANDTPSVAFDKNHPVTYAKAVTSLLWKAITDFRDADYPLVRAVCYDPDASRAFRPWLIQSCIAHRNHALLERSLSDGIPSMSDSEAALLVRVLHKADPSDAAIGSWAGRCLFHVGNAHSSRLAVESAFRSLSGEIGAQEYRDKLDSYQKTLRIQDRATLERAGARPMPRQAHAYFPESSTDAAFRRSFGSNALFSKTVREKDVRRQAFRVSDALSDPVGKFLVPGSVGEGKSFFLAACVRECLESDACGLPVRYLEGKDFAGWSEAQVSAFFLDIEKSGARLFVDAVDEIPQSVRQSVRHALSTCRNWCMVTSRTSEYPEAGKSEPEAYGFRIVRLEPLPSEAYVDAYASGASEKKRIAELLVRLGSAPDIRDNPLILSFLIRLSESLPERVSENRERGVLPLEEIDSVTALYESVMRLVLAGYEEGKWSRSVTFDREFLDGAMDFLSDFAYEISQGRNFADMKKRHRYLGKEYLEWLNAVFRLENKDEYRFSHQSVYEFFLARYHIRNVSDGIPADLRYAGGDWSEWRSTFPLARAYGNLLVDGENWETLDSYLSRKGLLAGDSALGENLFQAYGVFLAWERRMDRIGRIGSPEEDRAYSRIRERFSRIADRATSAQLTLWFESFRSCMANVGQAQDTIFTPKYLERLSEMPERANRNGMLEDFYRLVTSRIRDYHESDEVKAASKRFYSADFLRHFDREDHTWQWLLEDTFLSEEGGWEFSKDRKIFEEELYSILPTESLQALVLSAFQNDWDPSASFFERLSRRPDVATKGFFDRLGKTEGSGEFLARWHNAVRGPIRLAIEDWIRTASPDNERLTFVRDAAFHAENADFVLAYVHDRLNTVPSAASSSVLLETLEILSRIPGYRLSENVDWFRLAAAYLESETDVGQGFGFLSHLGGNISGHRHSAAYDFLAYHSLFRDWLVRLSRWWMGESPELRTALRSYEGKDAFEHRHLIQETQAIQPGIDSIRNASEWFYRSGYLERIPGPAAFVWLGYSAETNRKTFDRVSSALFALLEMPSAESRGMVDRAWFALHLIRLCIELARLDSNPKGIPNAGNAPCFTPDEWRGFFQRLEERLATSQWIPQDRAFDICAACPIEESNLLALGLLARFPDSVLREAYEVRWEGYPSFNESSAPRVLSLLGRCFPNREYESAEAFARAHPHLGERLDAIAQAEIRLRREYESSTKSEMRFLTWGKDRIRKELLVSLFREHVPHGFGSDDSFRIARKMSELPIRVPPFRTGE